MTYHKVYVGIVVEATNQQEAIGIVDAALVDVLFDYDERLRARFVDRVETADDYSEDAEDEE